MGSSDKSFDDTKESVDGSIGQNKENSDKDGDSSQKKVSFYHLYSSLE
jgi:hypothetical protein